MLLLYFEVLTSTTLVLGILYFIVLNLFKKSLEVKNSIVLCTMSEIEHREYEFIKGWNRQVQ